MDHLTPTSFLAAAATTPATARPRLNWPTSCWRPVRRVASGLGGGGGRRCPGMGACRGAARRSGGARSCSFRRRPSRCCRRIGWNTRGSAGASLIRGRKGRAEMAAAALAAIGAPPAVDDDLAADFLRLGLLPLRRRDDHRQHPLLTQPRCETAFEREVVAAAEAACGGDAEAARAAAGGLRSLHTAREYFLSQRVLPAGPALVAGSTIGPSLRAATGPSGKRRSASATCFYRAKCLEQWRPASRPRWKRCTCVKRGQRAFVTGGEARRAGAAAAANRGGPRPDRQRAGRLRETSGRPARNFRPAAFRHDAAIAAYTRQASVLRA